MAQDGPSDENPLAEQAAGNPSIMLLQAQVINLLQDATDSFRRMMEEDETGDMGPEDKAFRAVVSALACAKWESQPPGQFTLFPEQIAETLLTISKVYPGIVCPPTHREILEWFTTDGNFPPEGAPRFHVGIDILR
jgi:hypothetical protein